jgi:hypothetical protein
MKVLDPIPSPLPSPCLNEPVPGLGQGHLLLGKGLSSNQSPELWHPGSLQLRAHTQHEAPPSLFLLPEMLPPPHRHS